MSVLWEVFGENKNYNVLSGHKSAVLQVKWRSDSSIVSCSADKTVSIWDANRGQRVRKLTEHSAIVNSCSVVRGADANLIASGSDDCTAILWDVRSKQSANTFYHDYQVCAVALSADGHYVFTGGIDNVIRYSFNNFFVFSLVDYHLFLFTSFVDVLILECQMLMLI